MVKFFRGEIMYRLCQSCGMAMKSEEVLGTEKNGEPCLDYCKFCYKNSEFTHKVDMQTFAKNACEYSQLCAEFANQTDRTSEEMAEYCEHLLPILKRWK